MVDRISAIAKHDAGVVNFAGVRRELNIAHETGAPVNLKCGEHRLKPARLKNEIVVEQRKDLTLCDAGGAVVRSSVAQITFVQENDVRRWKLAKKVAGSIRRSVIDEENFEAQSRGQRGFEGSQALLRVSELVEYWDDERDLHSEPRLSGAEPNV